MGRLNSKIWKEFVKRNVNGRPGAECIHCYVFFKFINATKMVRHICKCIKCPNNIKIKYLSQQEKKKQKSINDFTNDYEHEDFVTNDLSSQNSASTSVTDSVLKDVSKSALRDNDSALGSAEITDSGRSTIISHSQSSTTYIKSKNIENYFDSMNESQKEDLDKQIARAIYVTGAPLSMFEHTLWQKVFLTCRPVYKLPTRYELSSKLLENEYNEIKSKVIEVISSAPHLHLQCDGWTNIRNNGIMNFVLSTPRPVFVKSVATGQNHHTAKYISDEIKKVLIEFDPMKFLVLIGDNAANVQKSFMLVTNMYPHLVPLNCLAHTINLLFNDIVCLESLIELKSHSISIVKSINRSQILKASFDSINKEQNFLCSLKLPAPTRWASFFYCLESLKSTNVSLQILAVREQTLPSIIKKLILDDSVFWVNIDNCIDLLKPMVKCITQLESDSSNIHNVYKFIIEIENNLKKNTYSSLLSQTDVSKMFLIFQTRKKNMIKPIHLAATVLNPSDQGTSLSPEEFIDANEFIYNLSKAIGMDTKLVMSDLANYKSKSSGYWIKNYLWESVNLMEPLVWWNGLCSFSTLSVLATSILSAPTTSAATERSFSTYGNIHTKKRNKLTCDRAGKITYISHNWKLLNNNLPKFNLSKLICGSSTEMPVPENETMNITEYECENVDDEVSSIDESFVIPYDDEETSECESLSEPEVEILTFDDI